VGRENGKNFAAGSCCSALPAIRRGFKCNEVEHSTRRRWSSTLLHLTTIRRQHAGNTRQLRYQPWLPKVQVAPNMHCLETIFADVAVHLNPEPAKADADKQTPRA
jgi:hypothetical protein